MVKGKVGGSRNSAAGAGSPLKWVVPALAVATFTASWAGLYPSLFVEQWYARRLFPLISCFAELIADAVSFSWLDMAVPVVVVSVAWRSEEHTSELQSRGHLVCRLLLEKKNKGNVVQ